MFPEQSSGAVSKCYGADESVPEQVVSVPEHLVNLPEQSVSATEPLQKCSVAVFVPEQLLKCSGAVHKSSGTLISLP